MRKCLIIIAAAMIALQICADGFADERQSWFTRKDEGWFFYKSKPQPPPEKEQEEEQQPVKPSLSLPQEVSKPAYQIIKEQGEKLLGNAMVNPTEENVRTYMEYQKQMLDDAGKFADVWTRVLAKHPHLYRSSFSAEDVAVRTKKSLRGFAKKTGLFFFYQADCPDCHKQAIVINEFKWHYNYEVIAISLDGVILPEIKDISKVDNGIAAKLGIKAVPAIYLAFPEENRIEPVSQGAFVPLTEIERRVNYYAKKEAETQKDDSFGLSQPYDYRQRSGR